MKYRRKNLEDLFIINPILMNKQRIYIWIGKNKKDLDSMRYCLQQCIINNIYFYGFVTDCKSLIGLSVLNKYIFDINEMAEDDWLVLMEDKKNTFYCPIEILNPKLNLSNIVVWGAGKRGKEIVDYFSKKSVFINAIIDENKKGLSINGIQINGAEKLTDLSDDVSLIEAANNYMEIDKIVQEKAPWINCFSYSQPEKDRNIVPEKLMYLRAVVGDKNIYVYGYNCEAIQLSRCLTILDYNFIGFLVDKKNRDEFHQENEIFIYPEEILYNNYYYVIITSDNCENKVKKLQALGLNYCTDFSPIETLSYYLLYTRKNIIDINLGHTYKQNKGINGIEIYGSGTSDSYKIVVLGGSTTDGRLFPFESWPQIMYNKINSDNVTIYNAGVSGYTSAQELIKMIRDVLLIKPDMIIVYDGYNDTSEINACPGKYFEFTYLKKALDYAQEHISHDLDFISQQSSETENQIQVPVISNFENWLMNIEIMHAIAIDRGILFYSFLQPMLSSKKNLTKEEKGILFEVENFSGLQKTSLMGREFRHKIADILNSHTYIYDLSNIFDDIHNIYIDICHVREDANKIIAEEILRNIEVHF